VFVQDKDSVSADYLRDKQNAEQQVLEDLMRASLAKQVNLNKALTAVMRKNPGMSRKEALKKVDGKLVRDASDALSSFREQQEHYRILAGFKGNMSVIPGGKIPVSPEFYAAIEAQFDPKTKKEIYATDPDLLGIQQGTPEYNRAKNSFIDEWYGQAALQSQGKAYPRPDVQA